MLPTFRVSVAKTGGVLLLLAILAGCATPTGPPDALPGLIVSLGDSITVAFNSDDRGDAPQHSWATGLDGNDSVLSFAERVRELRPDALALNDAVSGAHVSDLVEQAQQASRQRPDLVLVLIGANDACARPMTSAADFRARLLQAAGDLPRGQDVYILSVPDVTRLHDAMGDNETARAIWSAFRECPAALSGTDAERAEVRARIVEYNDAIAEVARERGWWTDEGALFGFPFGPDLVSPTDAFHPSMAGQAKLAEMAWAKGPFAGNLLTPT